MYFGQLAFEKSASKLFFVWSFDLNVDTLFEFLSLIRGLLPVL